jgi:hypothetical protein
MWVANLIWLLHMTLICFVVLTPFVGPLLFVFIDLVFMLGIAGHWALNSNVCCLTELEHALRGITDRSELFFEKLFGPVYGLNNSSSQWVGLIFLIAVCVWRLLKAWNEYKERNGMLAND